MDTSKRDGEPSPMKKKFKDSSISREELDAAIANGIRLAIYINMRHEKIDVRMQS